LLHTQRNVIKIVKSFNKKLPRLVRYRSQSTPSPREGDLWCLPGPFLVIPAQAGIHCCAAVKHLCLQRIVPTSSFTLDPDLRRDDNRISALFASKYNDNFETQKSA